MKLWGRSQKESLTLIKLQRADQAGKRYSSGAEGSGVNKIDESLNDFLKQKYGNCIKECKITIEVVMQLKDGNYEIVGAYFPKEDLELKIK